MKVLKILAILTAVLLVAAAGYTFYLFKTAKVEVITVSSGGKSASEAEAAFLELADQVEEETFIGTLFLKPDEWKAAENYAFLTYTVQLKNNCLVPVEHIELQIIPHSADLLQLGDLTEKSLAAGEEGSLSATLLTEESSGTSREMILTYYVWGKSFSLKVTP